MEVRSALTVGEPAGIGPDIVIQLVQHERAQQFFAIADPELLTERARQLGLPLHIDLLSQPTDECHRSASHLSILPVSLTTRCVPGQLSVENAHYVLECLRVAVQCCQEGAVHAMVTAPVQKSIMNDAGIAFSGHTEWLAEMTHTDHVVMLLVACNLRVALLTTHVPLREVADYITCDRLRRTVLILEQGLQRYFAIRAPRILVSGLNPHAGEGGHIGREEVEIISPCLQELRKQGLNLRGPLPADTLFNPKDLRQADAVLAMYHDQGLPVLKHRYFGRAVNVTLGLPFVRTSVDHGSALQLAGSGKSDWNSLHAALTCAQDMVHAAC